jgi:hypothetical protein
MGLSSSSLRQLLESNVVELKFTRKKIVPGRTPTRRMLASLNQTILDSNLGRTIFNFKAPTSQPAYNADSHDLVVVFDMFMQQWRAIPANTTEIIRVIPSDPAEDFWTYFNDVLSKMSGDQKAAFMNS